MPHHVSLRSVSAFSTLALALGLLAACEPATPASEQSAAPLRTDSATAFPQASAAPGDSVEQTIYVPVYSHIYHGDAQREFDLAVTLSLRNTDPEQSLTVVSVAYYDSAGQLVRRYLDAPVRLGPLASQSFVVAERDRTGGVGASFLVTWRGNAEVTPLLAEGVMISTASTQGLSFVSRGVVVRRVGPVE